MTNRLNVYPQNLSESDAVDLDTFLGSRPHAAWMYFIHLKTQPGRFLRDLAKKQYFIRKDGLIAIHDPEVGGKGSWDFYDPKQAAWFANKDLPEPTSIWGQGSPGIYQKRGRKPGWRKQRGEEVEVSMQETPPKRRRGRPPGSKNKPKTVQAEQQVH